MNNNYIYYCTNCCFKKIINHKKDLDNFIILKSSSIQSTIPSIDLISGKIRHSKDTWRPKIIKCPKCGFSNRVKQIDKNERGDNE